MGGRHECCPIGTVGVIADVSEIDDGEFVISSEKASGEEFGVMCEAIGAGDSGVITEMDDGCVSIALNIANVDEGDAMKAAMCPHEKMCFEVFFFGHFYAHFPLLFGVFGHGKFGFNGFYLYICMVNV